MVIVNNTEQTLNQLTKKLTMSSAERRRGEFYIDETRDQFGPHVRWKSNDRVPFDDMLECFQILGWITQQERDNSNHARDVDTAAFIAEYRANYRGPTAEQRAEARAAFGAGAEVVDVITGCSYRV